jgi:hypothetical protein
MLLCLLTGKMLEVLWVQAHTYNVNGQRLILAEQRDQEVDYITTQPLSNFNIGVLYDFELFCRQEGRDLYFNLHRTSNGQEPYRDPVFLAIHLWEDF